MAFYKLLYVVALVGGCGYGAIRGAAPERWGAAIVLVGMVLTNLAGLRSGHLFAATDTLAFWVDVVEAVALIWLACSVNRFWPLWVAMFQLDTVFTHIVMYSHAPPFSYGVALKVFALPLPLLVGIGAWRYRARKMRMAV